MSALLVTYCHRAMLKCVPPATDSGWTSVMGSPVAPRSSDTLRSRSQDASISFGTLVTFSSRSGRNRRDQWTSSGVLVSKIGSPAHIFNRDPLGQHTDDRALQNPMSEYSIGIEDHYAWANLVSVTTSGPTKFFWISERSVA